MYGMNSKGFRVKVGLDALSNKDQSNEQVAARYASDGIGADDVAKCRTEAAPVHEKMMRQHGPGYFCNLGLSRKPDRVIGLLALGSMAIAEF